MTNNNSMILELSLKPKEWHPIGEHKRIRCLSIAGQEEGPDALMDIELEIEWDGAIERIRLSTDSPEIFNNGLQYIYKGGWKHEAQLDIVIAE